MNLRFHLLKGTFAVHEPLEMFIDVLPRDIFPVCHPLEVGKEIAFHLGFVKEAVVLVEDGLITPVTQYLRFFHHACVEIAFLLVGRFGEDINPQSFTGYLPSPGTKAGMH